MPERMTRMNCSDSPTIFKITHMKQEALNQWRWVNRPHHATEIADRHGPERRARDRLQIHTPPTHHSTQCQQGPQSPRKRNQQQDATAPKKQRPHSGPKCSPQNEWTHSGSTRFAGSIRDRKMGPVFGPFSMGTLAKKGLDPMLERLKEHVTPTFLAPFGQALNPAQGPSCEDLKLEGS